MVVYYSMYLCFERCIEVPLESPTPGQVSIGWYVLRTTIA
jgi:hypothetical protein